MMMTPAGGILSLCIRPLSETRPHDSSLVLDVEEGRNPNSCLVSFVAWWWRSSRRVPVRVDSLWSLSTTTHNATDRIDCIVSLSSEMWPAQQARRPQRSTVRASVA